MVALYDSYVYPFVVLFSLPLAMVGAMVALAVTGKALSIFTMLGIIMLMGLVAKNAILLVDRTNSTREEQGLSVYDALLEAARARMRPILMTTLTMIFGMMPIALSRSSGSEWKSGLAWALIGGLTSSLFLTLVRRAGGVSEGGGVEDLRSGILCEALGVVLPLPQEDRGPGQRTRIVITFWQPGGIFHPAGLPMGGLTSSAFVLPCTSALFLPLSAPTPLCPSPLKIKPFHP